MSHAEKCPICKGSGNYIANKLSYNPERIKCHGCDGKGWITVQDQLSYKITPANSSFTIQNNAKAKEK